MKLLIVLLLLSVNGFGQFPTLDSLPMRYNKWERVHKPIERQIDSLIDIPDNYAYPCDESDCLDCNCSLLMTTPCPQHGGWGEPIRPNGNVKCKHIWVEIYGTENSGRLQGCAFVVCVKCHKEETQDREGPIRIKLIDASK